jgi:hypothetical protein
MTQKRKPSRWSFKDDRQLIELAAASKSMNVIVKRLGRPPKSILKKASQLGVRLGSSAAAKK